MQPTYLPWIGYFDLIKICDLFVFLDDVQFSKRSWQQRNKILNNENISTLTVPVFTKNRFHQKINETKINNIENWKKKHLSSIIFNYAKHEYFKEFFELYQKELIKDYEILSKLNISLIKTITNYLNINCNFELSSNFGLHKNKEDKIIEILKITNAKEYISAPGAIDYLGDGKNIIKCGFKFKYRNYKIKEYSQKNLKNFIPNLSIIDLIFNHGKNSIFFI
jgi:hypothetical protein